MADAIANAGSDPTVIAATALPTSQALSGSGTAGTGGSSITGYSWSIVSGPTGHGASLTSATTQTPTLSGIDTVGNYRILLVVTDDAANVSVSRTQPEIQADGTVLAAAPESAFVTVRVETQYAEIQKPASGERDYISLIHAHVDAIEQNADDIANMTVADLDVSTATGAFVDNLCDDSYATQNGASGGTRLHKHEGSHVDAATTSVRGAVICAEAPADSANPKAVTQDRFTISLTIDGTSTSSGYIPGKVGTPSAAGNESTANAHAYNPESASFDIEEISVAMSDAGTTAGGGYTFTVYVMTEAQFTADNFGAATTVGTLTIGAPSSDHEPGYDSDATVSQAVAVREIIAVKATTAPASTAAMGRGATVLIHCRKKF